MRTTRKNLVFFAVILMVGFGLSGTAWSLIQAVGPAAPAGTPATPPSYPAVMPHGFPGFYEDVNGVQLEMCLDPVDPVTGFNPCVFDPVIAGNAWSEATGFGAEAFYMLAQADTRPLVVGGKALLVLGIEAAYDGDGSPAEGKQITFGRVRVRFNAPGPAHYRVTHPYGVIDLPLELVTESLAVNRDIRLTVDIGGISPVDPAAAFSGALRSFGDTQVPFIAWDTFDADPNLTDPALVVRDPVTNAVTAKYIGDGLTPHAVVGSPTGNNLFRIEAQNPATGQWRIVSETNLFAVSGKIHTPPPVYGIYTYTNLPVQNLYAMGPVNRAAAFPLAGSELPNPGAPANPGDPLAVPPVPATPAIPTGDGFPIGFPYWYQDTPDSIADIVAAGGTPADAAPGVQLTLCPGGDPMCISGPVDFANPESVALNVGGESFYWSADADIAFRQDLPVDRRIDGKLVLAIEAAFGNALGVPIDGDQIVFARIRTRVRVDRPGRYTIMHPYGQLTFDVTDPRELINYTEDIGIVTPGVDPDGAMVGALYGKTNPFLKWTTFNPDPLLNDPALNLAAAAGTVMYVGSPLAKHQVVGSPIPDANHPSGFQNYFRIIDETGGIDTMSDLFTVTGKVYDPATFAPGPPPPGAPVAVADAFSIPLGQPGVLNVLANDTVTNGTATIRITLAPADATVTIDNVAGTVTYTPTGGGTAGVDTFAYQLTDANGLVSGIATVNVTMLPVEAISVTRAQLDTRAREWRIQGTANIPGSFMTVHAGPDTAGEVVGTAVVGALGTWQLRVRALANPAPNTTSISIGSSTGNTLLDQPLRVR